MKKILDLFFEEEPHYSTAHKTLLVLSFALLCSFLVYLIQENRIVNLKIKHNIEKYHLEEKNRELDSFIKLHNIRKYKSTRDRSDDMYNLLESGEPVR